MLCGGGPRLAARWVPHLAAQVRLGASPEFEAVDKATDEADIHAARTTWIRNGSAVDGCYVGLWRVPVVISSTIVHPA